MKKATMIIILVLFSGTLFCQIAELKNLHSQYVEYCNQSWDTTITQTSSFTFKDIPLYSDCGNGKKEVFGYKRVIADTVWDDSQKMFYNNDFSDTWESQSTLKLFNRGYITSEARIVFADQTSCTPPTRKVKAKVYNEKPSENGFYHWLFRQVSN